MKVSRLHNYLPKRGLFIFAAVILFLSFVSGLWFGSNPSTQYQQAALQGYVEAQQRDAQDLLRDTGLMRELVLQSESLEEFKKVEDKKYGVFLFAETISESEDPLFWNNQKILPPEADFLLADGIYFQLLKNGYYITQKKSLRLPGMTNNVIAYILIPVLHKYYLQTPNLRTQFVHDESALKQITISTEPTEFAINSIEGEPLFYIKRVAHSNAEAISSATVFFRLGALLLLLLYLQAIAEVINRKRGAVKAIIFITVVLVGLRLILFYFPQLLSLRQYPLFDPSIYASSEVNRSLGDLLLHAIFTCWIILFAWYSLGPPKNWPQVLKGKALLVTGITFIFLLIFTTFQLAGLVHDLVTKKISFNVTDFFSLDIYTVFGFVVLALLSLSYYYFSRLLFAIIRMAFPNLLHLYFLVALTGLFLLTVHGNESAVLFQLPVLSWLVVYTLLLSQEGFVINRFRITIAGILFWIFIFSVSLSLLVMKGNRETELRNRIGIADKYDQLTEPSRESTLSIASTYLDNRYLKTNFPKFYSDVQNKKLRDSILTDGLFNITNAYNIQIYIYDSLNRPLYNDDNRSFAEVNTLLKLQGNPTGIPELFYIETSFDRFIYILKRNVTDSPRFVGSFFILSTPKQYHTSDAPYLEFFRQPNVNDPANSPFYNYAIYKENLLRNHSGKYAFPVTITDDRVPKGEMDEKVRSDESGTYDELWFRGANKKVIVVAKKQDSLLESITLFSYLFCAFLFMVGLLRLFAFVATLAGNRRTGNLFSSVNIRTQIHGTIIFISVLSFLIIGIATISFFIARYNRNNIDRLSRTASVTVKEMQRRVEEAQLITNEFSISDPASKTVMQNLVMEIADLHDVDANVYDLQGNLLVSSSYEEVYTRGILSTKMHPMAFYRLNNLHEVQRVQQETMSSLKYLSIYTAIRDNDGKVYAYLNIPYFSSQSDLRQEISNFFVTIINLNAFIFLLAGVIALFITNKITRSFSVIGNKMKEITFGKTNEEIVWNRSDEIGDLVTQYNIMVNQLEQSAEALAKSEREGAWREMARQVAHEIKNPLTPMKLSIQYLQKAIQNNQPNIQLLTTNVANTLIEQIDHLSKIAADFSQFANIGNKKLEIVDLHSIIGSLVDLYAPNPKMDLQWHQHPEGLFMRTDKTHMNRLFTNLLTNAADACVEKEKCTITITEKRGIGQVVISISDNGEGIPEETKVKIFTPNFTTKTSGTGLGLAMCKSIVEQAGGDIWFETAQGRGTTFYVQLPLVS